jgi:DNA repair exonuclease SbcCD ATPase subunit
MTADFQGAKSDKPDTEQILLKSIAEKMTAIEARQKEETENKRIKELEAEQERMRLDQANKEARDVELEKLKKQEAEQQRAHEAELARIRQEEQDRIRQREQELADLREQEQARLDEERRQIFEAQQEAAKDRLRQDSLRLALLTEQLDDLKRQLSAVDLEEEQRLKLELEQKRREAEQTAIRDREEKLKQQMAELETQRLQASVIPEEDDNMLPLFLIGAAVLVAIAILLGAMMGGRRRTEFAPAGGPVIDEDIPEARREPEVIEDDYPEPDIDPELLNEVDGIKKSVVSLAVSKPGNASNIVKEWLKDTGATEEAEAEEAAEEESNGKNKKKGKK